MTRDAKGATSRGAFNAAGLANLPANLLNDPAALGAFSQQAISQLKPEEQVALQNSLAQQMAQSYLATSPSQPGWARMPGSVDLENGLLRLQRSDGVGGAANTLASTLTGGRGYGQIRLPSQFGDRVIPLGVEPGAIRRNFQSSAEADQARQRYAASRALLGSLAQALSGR
jgi:hypothetical protein